MISGKDPGKVSFLIHVFLLSFFMAACASDKATVTEKSGEAGWMVADSMLADQLDDSLRNVLFDPDTVKCYHLSYKDKIKERDVEVVKDYVQDSLVSVLPTSQTCILQYVLLSDISNYSNDTVLVQSPYLPILEFRFEKKGLQPVSIVISTLDRSWQMIRDGKCVHSHNIAATRQVERFCSYFMNVLERKEDKK